MPLTLVTGPANAEKAGHVLAAYVAAADREPVLVVPTFPDVQRYRRELAERGIVHGAEVSTWSWLERTLLRRARVSGRTLGRVAAERLAASVVRSLELPVLGRSAGTPGFARQLVRLADELEAGRVTPQRFYTAVRQWAAEEPARAGYAEDLAALYGAWERALERHGRRGRTAQLVAALDVLRAEPRRWGGAPVFLYGFDDLSAVQRDAVETLAVHVDADVLVSLPYEPGRAAFAGRHETHADLRAWATEEVVLEPRAEHYAPAARPVLHHLERHLFEPEHAQPVPADDAVLLLRGGGQRAELELVGAHVARLLREGMDAEEIAVVLRGVREHTSLVEEVFGAFGIPFAMQGRRVALGHTALGRGVLALTRCALDADATADALLTYLRTPGLLRVAALADRLEEDVRRNGERSAVQARARFEAAHFPLAALDRVAGAARRGPVALCERLSAEAQSLFAGPFRGTGRVLAPEEEVDAAVAAELRRALRELATLAATDDRVLGDPLELLEVLAGIEVRIGRRPGPGLVTVADPLDVRARRVRALFCCAMTEGRFPRPPRPEPLLGDAERRALNAASGLRLRLDEDPIGAERYLLYATVSRPTDLLALSWHAADEDGRPQVRSLFVDDVLDLLAPGTPVQERPLGAVGFEDGLAPTARERDRAVAADATTLATPAIAPLADARVLERLAARATWSASALETWLACPVRWFVERLLRAEELVPDPEPMIRGLFAHAVLERALRGVVPEDGPRPLRPADLPALRRGVHEAIAELRDAFKLSANPERARSALVRLEADVLRYVERAATSGSAFAPAEFEVAFGGPEDPLPGVAVGEGLTLSGRVDRLDRGPGGELLVYDYKGASGTPQAKWADDGRLQLALYALALPQLFPDRPRVAGALYQPLSKADQRPRGALRAEADADLDVSRNDRVDDAEFEALLADARDRALAAVREIRAGRLTPTPATCGWRDGGCTYPSICRCETT